MRQFPERYRLVNDQVAELHLYYPLSADDVTPEDLAPSYQFGEGVVLEYGFEHGYYDFFVTLRDGRCFGFSAHTPEHLRQSMDDEHELSFVTSGLVVVSEITVEAILDALEKCLDKGGLYGLEHFGYPCEP
jgi:hypothetical protein